MLRVQPGGCFCPNCGDHNSKVMQTFKIEGINYRVRKCFRCKTRYKTVEYLMEEGMTIPNPPFRKRLNKRGW